jgi:hypothetical protein
MALTAKQIKQKEARIVQTLRDAGKAEIKFLKVEGAPKSVIQAEQRANKTEVKDAKSLLKPVGEQTIPQLRQDGFIRSNVSAYQDLADVVLPKIEQAIGLLDELNIQQAATKSTDNATITTGMSLNNAYALANARASGQPITAESLKAEFGDYVSGANRQAKIYNAVNSFASNPSITAEDFDKKLKPVKGIENLFTSKIGGGTTGTFQFDPATQTYRMVSATPVKVTETGGGGFLSGALNIIGSIITPFNPLLGSTLVAAGTGVGGGDFGDILKNVALNYAGYRVGGAITQGLGLGSIPSLSDDLAAATNLLTNPADELIGVASSIKTAAQNAGSTIYDAVTNPQQIIDDFTNRVANSPAAGLFRDPVAVQNPNTLQTAANQVFQTPPPGTPLPAQNLPAGTPIPAPPVSVTATTPSITGGLVAPAVTVIGSNQRPPSFQPTLPPGVLGGQPIEPTPPRENEGGLLGNVDLGDVITGAGIIAGAAGGGGTTTGSSGRPPVLAPDIDFTIPVAGTNQFTGIPNMPGMGGGLDFNAFMNLYQRGGLGAGQYLGYDLLNRLGDIPAETLLGTPILGGNIGQTSPSTASLV